MLIIPALDILGGRAVRLVQGDFARETVYGDDPVAVAEGFFAAGARWIHIVDLDGARAGSPQNLEVAREIASHRDLHVQMGGGARSLDAIETLLAIGVRRVVLGTVLVRDPELARRALFAFPSEMVAGLDVKDGQLATEGWREGGGGDPIEVGRRLFDLGCERFVVTDVATDGMLSGPNLGLMRRFAGEVPGALVASGGVGSLEHLDSLAALDPGPEAAIVGKALYEGRFTLADALARAQPSPAHRVFSGGMEESEKPDGEGA